MNTRAGSWKLRYWILAGYAIPFGAMAVSTAVTATSLSSIQRHTNNLERLNRVQYHIGHIYAEVENISKLTRGYLLSGDRQILDEIAEQREVYGANLDTLEPLLAEQGRSSEIEKVRSAIQNLKTANNQLLEQAQEGETAAAITAWRNGVGRAEAQHLSQQVEQLFERNNSLVAQASQAQTEALKRLVVIAWSITLVSLLLSLLAAWAIFSRTAKRMNESANAIVRSSSVIGETVTVQELATQQQAKSIQETNTSMDALNQSSQQSAQQASVAQTEAQQARQLAEQGRQAVERTLQCMDDLQGQVEGVTDDIRNLLVKTEQISTISSLVSDLANQTNMLALNAAVEAVRAGDDGRGFSVVSSEIRELADRSKVSAAQIAELIAEIQNAATGTAQRTVASNQTMTQGVAIVRETADVFQGVTLAVNTIATNNEQIALNLQHQAAAIEQIASAMTDLKQIAQQTVEGIQQVKTGTNHLNDAATVLQTFV